MVAIVEEKLGTRSHAPLDTAPVTSRPRLGAPAPPFETDTTHGRLRFEDFRGNWVILFSHPADFIPVCTTEFKAFAQLAPEWRERGAELPGSRIFNTLSHTAPRPSTSLRMNISARSLSTGATYAKHR